MKNFTIIFAFLILFLALGNIQAQSPESMNYQAVIRDVSGNIIASQAVGVRITLLQGNASGTNVYRETFSPTTTAYGLISLKIGTGTVFSGTFATIDWGANSHYVETAVDIAGGTNYTVISTTQLMSVPYALYAKTSGNSIWQQDSISDINFGQGNVRIWETTEGLRLSVTGGTPLILKRNKSIANFGVPINFNLLNSSNEDTRYGQVVSSIRDNTAGAEFGSLSFLVADGSGTWSNGYAEERLRIETERVIVKNVMNLEPLNAAPSSPLEGDLYYDNAANQVKVYDGSSWVNLAGSSSPWTESGSNVYRNSGNVGIGTTSPTTLLQVSDSNAEGPTFKIDGLSPSILLQDNSGVSNTVDNFEIRNNLGKLQINYGDNADANDDGFLSTNAFTISNTGNLGIGTSDPKEKLQLGTKMFFHAGDVVNAIMYNQFSNGSMWKYASNGPASGIEFNSFGQGAIHIWTATSGTAGSQVSPQGRLLITNDGKIGVGTTTPAYKLDVNGDVNLTGSLRINGVAQTFGSGSSSTNATTFNYLSDGF